MNEYVLHTPLVLVIYNRPELTKIVFEAIRQVRPKSLLVVADGPIAGNPDDVDRCKETRAIIDKIDWDCDLLKNYSEVNLGCGKRPASGFDWAFGLVEEAIILEDDCVPNNDFFIFCEHMLEKYRNDKRVMCVSGANLLGKWKSDEQSYHYSYFSDSHGWATWRRAWEYYDYEVKLWGNEESRSRVRGIISSKKYYTHKSKFYQFAFDNYSNVTWWDYQWEFTRLTQSGLTIVPAVNLIENIGIGEVATHTKAMEKVKVYPLSFPIKINDSMSVDRKYDDELLKRVFFYSQVRLSKLLCSVFKGILRRIRRLFYLKLKE